MCWHKWGKWETYKQGNVYTYYVCVTRITGSYFSQQKTCEKCGKVKLRTVETE